MLIDIIIGEINLELMAFLKIEIVSRDDTFLIFTDNLFPEVGTATLSVQFP